MTFRLVPISVTLNDLERRNSLFCIILPNSVASGAHCVIVVEDMRKHSATEMQPKASSFSDISLTMI